MNYLINLKKIGGLLLAVALWSCGSGSNDSEKKADVVATDIDTVVEAKNEEPKTSATPSPFSKEVTYNDIKFTVTSPGSEQRNTFTLTPQGLQASNDPYTESIDGKVKDVIVDDIDGDNSPEVGVIVVAGPNEKGKAYIFSANNNKSLSGANLPEISSGDKSLNGYNGHDEYNFVEGSFIRRFPIYDGEQKTEKMRQFQYKLKSGEAMKQLVLYKTTEY